MKKDATARNVQKYQIATRRETAFLTLHLGSIGSLVDPKTDIRRKHISPDGIASGLAAIENGRA
jgi:hypothetical protein